MKLQKWKLLVHKSQEVTGSGAWQRVMLKQGSWGFKQVNAGAPSGSAIGQILQNTSERHPRTLPMRSAYKETQ